MEPGYGYNKEKTGKREEKIVNILQNLLELYNHLSPDSTYRVVVKGILENLDQMQNVTIYDVAEITNSSRTTVWRMVQKMGYHNFSDFRHALQNAVSQYTYYNRIIPAKYCGDPSRLLEQVTAQLNNASRLLERNCSPELISGLTEEIYEADKIRFYLPFQLSFVYSFQQNMAKSGKDTAYCVLQPDMLEDAETLDTKSIVIISTIEYAETLDMHVVFQKIHEKEAKIWLAGDARTQYHRFADRILLDEEAGPVSWLPAFEAFILTLSEYYRFRYIDDI